MKKVFVGIAVLAALALMAGPARGSSFRPLLEQERAAIGATHVLEVDYADMADATTTNAAYTNSFDVAAKTAVRVVAAVLETAFDTGDTNYTGSLALTIGDTNDTDRLLGSMELASDGTEVFLKLGSPVSGAATTVAVGTNVSQTLTTNLIYDSTGAACSNAAGAEVYIVTASELNLETDDVYSGYTLTDGAYVYTAAETINCLFTPNAEESPSANTSGKVRVYFKIISNANW
jgi:hypothetical protein